MSGVTPGWRGAIQIEKSSATLSDNRIEHALGGIDLIDALPTRVLHNTLIGIDGTGIGISVIRYEPESELGSELVDNSIRGYRAGIYLADASPRVAGNTVESNQIGVMVDRGGASIVSNSIRGNVSQGIWLQGASKSVVKGNSLVENGRPGGFDLYIDVPQSLRSVDARENFWGTSDIAEIAKRIFDGADDPTTAVAKICPVRARAGGELRTCPPPH